jgi:hypothetical protein
VVDSLYYDYVRLIWFINTHNVLSITIFRWLAVIILTEFFVYNFTGSGQYQLELSEYLTKFL